MILLYHNERARFEAVTTFDERHGPRGAGFRWDKEVKRWWTDQATTAVTLVDFADDSARPRLRSVIDSLKASRAEDADVTIPAPEGMEYMPFQRAGISYALKRDATLIGDEMGLGKTIEAMGFINARELRNVLILCPASLCLNWQRELRKWLISGGMLVSVAGTREFPGSHIVVCAYSRIAKHAHAVRRREWDLIIADECQNLKNRKAQRTQAVFGRRAAKNVERLPAIKARYKLALSGTPIPNRPVEIWPVLNWLDPETWSNWVSFVRRFCAGFKGAHGWDASGASNLDVLQDRLRATVMVRRRKADVLTELPAKQRQVVIVEPPDAETRDAIKSEGEAWRRYQRGAADLRTEVELAKASTPDEYREAVAKLSDYVRLAMTEISKERHRVAVAKAPTVVEWCKDTLAEKPKICVFAHHKDVVKLLQAELRAFNPVTITGDTPVPDRQPAVDTFQTDRRCRVFIGSITAAGTGLTLTAADHAIFAELDWVPSNITQAEDRIHRIGQESSVMIQHVVFDGSLDAMMAEKVVEKQEIADRALDIEPVREPLLPIAAPATVSASRKAIARAADNLNAAQVATIHGRIRWLRDRCDGATALDGAGFNAFDAPLCHRLADLPSLTPKQAALAARIMVKYKGQLEGCPVDERSAA